MINLWQSRIWDLRDAIEDCFFPLIMWIKSASGTVECLRTLHTLVSLALGIWLYFCNTSQGKNVETEVEVITTHSDRRTHAPPYHTYISTKLLYQYTLALGSLLHETRNKFF